ncbi:hypothetical protein SLEP1_g51691 [Rubroshorea leprosula]|uniref:Uncharacterized protein n=1 Tax=Rubroshorea leprosula TaxID=152421 RepID=A0AAV5M425_9ROSI|nr:hypothetical protein SLEP1_g51691 [Rubroshorea leprosula]
MLLKQGVFIWAMLCSLLVFACKRVLAAEGVVNAGYEVVEQSICILLNGRDFYNYTMAMEVSKDGVFQTLHSDFVFLTRTINIGVTALVTDAATAIFGEAGVRAAIGVAILLLTEITPKSIAIHNPTEVARFGLRLGGAESSEAIEEEEQVVK